MPGLPQYGQVTDTSGIRIPQAQTPDVSSGLKSVGNELSQASDQLATEVDHERDKDAAAAAAKAQADLQAAATPLLASYKTLTGMHALDGDATTKLLGQIEEKRQALLGALGSRAAERFDVESRGQIESYRSVIDNHAAEQVVVARQAGLTAQMQASEDGLAYAYSDPAARAKLIAAPEKTMRDLAYTPAAADAAIAGWRAKQHQKVIDYFLNVDHDPVEAARYLTQHKDELGQALQPALHDVQVAARTVGADKISASWIADSQAKDPNGFAHPEVALARLETDPTVSKDPYLKHAVREALEQKVQDAARVEKATKLGWYDGVFSAVEQRGWKALNEPPVAKLMDKLEAYDPEGADALKMKRRRDAEYYDRLRREKDPVTPEEQDAFVDGLTKLAMNPDRYTDPTYQTADFRKEFGGRLPPPLYKALGEQLAKVKEKANDVSTRDFGQQVRAAAVDAGIDPDTPDGKRELAKFSTKATIWMGAETAGGKAVNQRDFSAKLKELKSDVWVDRFGSSWFGPGSKKGYELEPDDVIVPPPGQPAAPASATPGSAVPTPAARRSAPSAVDDAALTAILQAQGVTNPSPEDIAGVRAEMEMGK